jgi:uncharacterized protein (DUF58 family)
MPSAVSPVAHETAFAWEYTGKNPARVVSKRWRRLLWSLIYPYQGNRLLVTIPGTVVIASAMAFGAAAYNTANNILFIALSLLLACMVFSGLLSAINLRRLAWRLGLQGSLRAGQNHPAYIELRNDKPLLPCYGLSFEVRTSNPTQTTRLPLRERLDPLSSTTLEWTLQPTQRGSLRVEVHSIASLFPFGFLKKILSCQLKREVLVWPATVEYQHIPTAAWRQAIATAQTRRTGSEGDLLAIRDYAPGDPPRQVHWKASARLGRLVVRQHAAQTQIGYAIWVNTTASTWTHSEQFELMCSLAATLAEDFFRVGRLVAVRFDSEAARPVQRRQDLDTFLDQLALIQPTSTTTAAGAHLRPVTAKPHSNQLTFAPEGTRGVCAYLDGEKAATA